MTTEYERWAELSDRDATGESLSDADREFLRRFASEDALAQAETEFWEEMGNLDAPGGAEEAVAQDAHRDEVGKRTGHCRLDPLGSQQQTHRCSGRPAARRSASCRFCRRPM
jgi:hypothetical protein